MAADARIDHGIPVPRPGSGKGRIVKYPLAELEVGDSFFIPEGKSGYVLGSARSHRPKTFTTRKVTENDVVGIRCWRVK